MKALKFLSAAALALASMQAEASVFVGYTATPNGAVVGSAKDAHDQFIASLSSYGVENFDSKKRGVGSVTPLTFTGSLSNTAVLTGPSIVQGAAGGIFPTSGANALSLSGNGRIDFASPVNAFGFYATDVGDRGALFTVTAFDGTSTTYSPGAGTTMTDGGLLFFGLTSTTPIASISLNGAKNSDNFGFDDMTVGAISAVPESATWGMMLLGIGAVGCSLRSARKNRAQTRTVTA